MELSEYALYLSQIINDPDAEVSEEPEDYYGFFQQFMPMGTGAEKVLEPLNNGKELTERIKKVFTASETRNKEVFDKGEVPAYFCPHQQTDEAALKGFGNGFIADLKDFATFIGEDELTEMLNEVTEVIVSDTEVDAEADELNAYLYDCISDWALENEFSDEALELLEEAYYSINCDYYLAYYLQYPAFEEKPENDFLKHYFSLWEYGYKCAFENGKLVIFP